MTLVEIRGLELFAHHGVDQEERERGQRFLFDVELDVGDAGASDRIEDAIDYRDVVRCVRDVSENRRYSLLEALASAVAGALVDGFRLDGVRVRVSKPDLGEVAGLPVDHTAATVERTCGQGDRQR